MGRKRKSKYYLSKSECEAIAFLIVYAIFAISGFVTKYFYQITIILIVLLFICILIKYHKKITQTFINLYDKYYINKLKSKSRLYQEIVKLNYKYEFSDLQPLYFSEFVSRKSYLENCNIDDYLLMNIDKNEEKINNYRKKHTDYLKKYLDYRKEYSELKKYIDINEAVVIKTPIEKYLKYQDILYESSRIKKYYEFSIIVYINYNSEKGRVKSKIYKKYNEQDYMKIYNDYLKLKEENRLFEISSKIERAKMSNSLRYDVLKRDNYKCQICGRSAKDGVKLEVDHIIPVSKGGKTELSNLQVLCNICNNGKSNKL